MLTSFSTRFILLLAACALCSPLALAITPDELKAFRGTYSLDAANYPGCDALIQIATSSTSLQIRSLDEASNTSNGAIFGFESIDLGTVNKDGASVASRYDAQTLTLWTTLKTASNGSTLVTTLTRDSIAKHLRWSRKFSRATHAPWTCTYTRR